MSFSIPETSTGGAPVGQLSATDPEPFQNHSYSLIDDAGGRFTLSGFVIIVMDNTTFDYESGVTQYTITARVTDDGVIEGRQTTPLSFDATVTVNITDSPEPPTDILLNGVTSVSIPEMSPDLTVIGTITVLDPDQPSLNEYEYSLIVDDGGPFALDGDTLIVNNSLHNPLDFETRVNYTIIIKVLDMRTEPFSSVQREFLIQVENVVEGCEIRFQGGNITTPEDTESGTVIVEFSRFSLDLLSDDPTAAITLDDPSGLFELSNGTSLICKTSGPLNPLNYEQRTSYDINLRCNTGAWQTFTVYVTDLNEAPLAVNVSGSLTIQDDALPGTVVGIVSGIDRDSLPDWSLILFTVTPCEDPYSSINPRGVTQGTVQGNFTYTKSFIPFTNCSDYAGIVCVLVCVCVFVCVCVCACVCVCVCVCVYIFRVCFVCLSVFRLFL